MFFCSDRSTPLRKDRFEAHQNLESKIICKFDFDSTIKKLFCFGKLDHLSAISKSLKDVGYFLKDSLYTEHFFSLAHSFALDRDLAKLDTEHIFHFFPSQTVWSCYQSTSTIRYADSFVLYTGNFIALLDTRRHTRDFTLCLLFDRETLAAIFTASWLRISKNLFCIEIGDI